MKLEILAVSDCLIVSDTGPCQKFATQKRLEWREIWSYVGKPIIQNETFDVQRQIFPVGNEFETSFLFGGRVIKNLVICNEVRVVISGYLQKPFQPFRLPGIVGVKDRDLIPLGFGKTVFRARDGPPFVSMAINLTWGEALEIARTTSRVSSFEASSTTMISSAGRV